MAETAFDLGGEDHCGRVKRRWLRDRLIYDVACVDDRAAEGADA